MAESMDLKVVHRCRKFNFKPCAIQCIAIKKSTDFLVALSRSDGSIEIWFASNKVWFCRQVIPATKGDSIESLAWVDDRLISGSLQGVISEYDSNSNSVQFTTTSLGGAVWCLAYSEINKNLAIGCEDGCVRIYSVEPELEFKKSYYRVTGRILAIAWHKEGKILVTGSSDIIRIWNTTSGQVQRRISLEREIKNVETTVWALFILDDYTIVSGDSYGRVQFWDSTTCTLLDSFRSHSGDVLSICVAESQKSIFAAGIDPKVIEFRCITSSSGDNKPILNSWLKGRVIHSHTHDVRALDCRDNTIFSGGIDTKLIINSLDRPPTINKLLPFSSKSLATSSLQSQLVLFQNTSDLELMEIASCKTDFLDGEVVDGTEISVDRQPKFLLRLKVPESDPSHIVTSCLSPCGKWIAYSTNSAFRLYNLEYNKGEIDVKLHRIHNKLFRPSSAFVFSNDGTLLLAITNDHQIEVFHLDVVDLHAELLKEVPVKNPFVLHHLISVSPNKKYFATANIIGEVDVYTCSESEFFCSLPHYEKTPTAIHLDDKQNLLAVYSDLQVFEFNLMQKKYTKWSNDYHSSNSKGSLKSLLPMQKSNSNPATITHIAKYSTKTDKILLFVSRNGLFIFQQKKSKKELTIEGRFCDKFLPIIHANFNQEMVFVVEQPLSRLEKMLPPAIYKKKFRS